MRLRCVIADDEPLVRDELRFLLESTGHVEILGEAANGEEALRLVKALRPDALFLDVQMPGLTGMQVADALRAEAGRPLVVFATAYDDWAIEAFRLRAFDYLLKPFEPVRVNQAVAELLARLAEPTAQQAVAVAPPVPRRLVLAQEGRTVLVDPQEVLWAAADNEGSLVKTERTEYRTGLSLQALSDRLPAAFLRVHRQYLVNMARVVEFIPWPGGLASVVLDDRGKSRVPVARGQVRRVKALLGIG